MNNQTVLVKISGMDIVKKGMNLKTTLGSCVGVIFSDRKRSISGLAHIMLPEQRSDDSAVGKYADTAIPALVKEMALKGSSKSDMKAFLVGGANMFKYSSEKIITTIGKKNIEAAKNILGRLQIPVVFEDTGGNYGRTIIFNNITEELSIRTLNMAINKGENN